MRPFDIEIDGLKKRVFAMKSGPQLWVHIDGETRVLDMRPKGKRGAHGQGSDNGGDILAPMPGRILKINVKSGEQVSEKQVLVVMEAMKMEYSLSASAAGTVVSVQAQEGQQVELGQLLVKLDTGAKK